LTGVYANERTAHAPTAPTAQDIDDVREDGSPSHASSHASSHAQRSAQPPVFLFPAGERPYAAPSDPSPLPPVRTSANGVLSSLSAPRVPVPEGLSPREEMAAALDASGRLTTGQVARAAGLTYRQLQDARETDVYRQYIRTILSEAAADSRAHAIATRAGRISSLQRRHDALAEVAERRGAAADPRYMNPDPDHIRAAYPGFDPDVLRRDFPCLGELYDPTDPACAMSDPAAFYAPGASSGLLVKTEKNVGTGLTSRPVTEWSVDSSLLAAQLELEKRAAVETGQAADGVANVTQKLYVNINMDAL
jgi:hypothetical protein